MQIKINKLSTFYRTITYGMQKPGTRIFLPPRSKKRQLLDQIGCISQIRKHLEPALPEVEANKFCSINPRFRQSFVFIILISDLCTVEEDNSIQLPLWKSRGDRILGCGDVSFGSKCNQVTEFQTPVLARTSHAKVVFIRVVWLSYKFTVFVNRYCRCLLRT